ncbi:MAG: alpha-amylase family glycosyl hydrolase [Rhodothermales bacterium]
MRYVTLLAVALLLAGCEPAGSNLHADEPGWQDEIIYHVSQRSFYDSNGDRHGDLNGIKVKLPYLKELGVTAILFMPLYQSNVYHNYFPTDYEAIDPEFGTMDDYLDFVRAVHENGLKFIMDMETQYAANGHRWFDDSYRNPTSPYDDYIYYFDDANAHPAQMFAGPGDSLMTLNAWPDVRFNIVFLNLNNPMVRAWEQNFFAHWVDPNGDGQFDDGVDGFRLDHIMDDLDHKGVFTDLYAAFWKPILDRVYSINPNLFIVGEQSNWLEFGEDMMAKTGANAAFGFPIRFAISGAPTLYMGGRIDPADRDALNATKIKAAVEETMRRIPPDRYFINFIENHDMERWASAMEGDRGRIRAGGALTMLLPGIPSIYYGQELGLPGLVGEWGHDGNHIPVRDAFPWTPNPDDAGIAAFAKDTGPWWDVSYFNTPEIEQLAYASQKNEPGSLWHFYRALIALRKRHRPLMHGDYATISHPDSSVYAFSRALGDDRVVAVFNLSDEARSLSLDEVDAAGYHSLFGEPFDAAGLLSLEAYGFAVLGN